MTSDSRPDGETAAYIASLTASLTDLARQQGFTELGYVLDMARLEAESCARRIAAEAAVEPDRSAADPPDEP